MTVLLTGCPHNEYLVELTPRGHVIERKLVFYRQDGTDTNGSPNYQVFPNDELLSIGKFYPPGGLSRNGERRAAVGQFRGALPGDVGGAGSYLNLSNSLGSAAVYTERFRGDDDFTRRMEQRAKAADQLTDLIIGWSERELGKERKYRQLRRFLDHEFRRDLKNLSFYTWMLQAAINARQNDPKEFAWRFGQYLTERGYLKVEDSPDLFRSATENDTKRLLNFVQKLVAAKMGIPAAGPMPRGLMMLADPDAAWKSWEEYLRTTPVYRSRLQRWQKEKLLWRMRVAQQDVADFMSSRTNSSPRTASPTKPDPSEVAAELTLELVQLQLISPGTPDHLVVRLRLSSAPTHTNGKWDEGAKSVIWESDLEQRTNGVSLPAFCYASWSESNEPFQKEHFGKVVLQGEELLKYCLWRGSLDRKQAEEWEAFLTDFKPTLEAINRLESFRFSSEGRKPEIGETHASLADLPRELIKAGLGNVPALSESRK